jgi:hypothetical protein
MALYLRNECTKYQADWESGLTEGKIVRKEENPLSHCVDLILSS